MVRLIAPCKGCPDRVAEPNCHITCERYLTYVRLNKEMKDEIHKQKEIDAFIYSMNARRGRMGGVNVIKQERKQREKQRRSK